jgi:hypothetical protein
MPSRVRISPPALRFFLSLKRKKKDAGKSLSFSLEKKKKDLGKEKETSCCFATTKKIHWKRKEQLEKESC